MPEFQAPGYQLHYDWANGFNAARPTVVLLHDGLGAVGSWRTLPQRIANSLDTNVLAYDRFGYGRSQLREAFENYFMEGEVPVLLALLDHLKIPRAHLVGHSDGGSIALLFAGRYPERVGTVVTEAAHVFVEPETQQGIRNLVKLQAEGQTPGWLFKLHGERGDQVLSTWSESWLSDVHGQWNIEAHLPAVKAPVLAIQGDSDEFGTQAQVDAILEGISGAASWIVPACGHTPHTQVEDDFLEKVTGFLQPRLP